MTYLSHQDGEHTGKASLGLAEKLGFLGINTNTLNADLRKTAHVFLFFVFIILLNKVLENHSINAWYGIAFSVFWAWADERTKPFIKGRHFSWFDVGLNVCGFVLGMAAWIFLKGAF